MPRYLHSEDDMVYACPNCDSAPVYQRKRKNRTVDPDNEFACYECNSGFDEPVEREKRAGGDFDWQYEKLSETGKKAVDS